MHAARPWMLLLLFLLTACAQRAPTTAGQSAPSGLMTWPTPTPYVMPVMASNRYHLPFDPARAARDPAARIALDFVVRQEGVAPDLLKVPHNVEPILRPTAGDEVRLVYIQRLDTNHVYQVLVDAGGAASYLLDYRRLMIDYIAAEEGVPPEELEAGHVSDPYFPLTRQKVWVAKVVQESRGEMWGVAVDVEGRRLPYAADEEAERQEQLARKQRCGGLRAELCALYLEGGDELVGVRVWVPYGGLEHLLPWFEAYGVTVVAPQDLDERRARQRATPTPSTGLLMPDITNELSLLVPRRHLAELNTIRDGWALEHLPELRRQPLNTNLKLSLRQREGGLELLVTTQSESHAFCGTVFDVELTRPQAALLQVEAHGFIYGLRLTCPTVIMPPQALTQSLPLGQLQGEHELVVVAGELRDRHRLIVDEQGARLETIEARFTWAGE